MFQHIQYGVLHGIGAIILPTGIRGNLTTGIIITVTIHITIVIITGIIVTVIITVIPNIMIIITMVIVRILTRFISTGRTECTKIRIPILKHGTAARLTLIRNILMGIVQLPDQA